MPPMKNLRTMMLVLALALLGVSSASAQSSTPDSDRWVTDGAVNAIVHAGGITYIGGEFSHVWSTTGHWAPLSTATGQPLAIYPKVNGYVCTTVADGSGGWYIGGRFTQVGTMPRTNIAHIRADYSVDPNWNPNTQGSATHEVRALVVSGATVYVGGSFTAIGGQARNGIAALNAATGLATAWNPDAGGGGTVAVYALAVSGAAVYAGGEFTTIGGQARENIAALNAVTGVASTWNPGVHGISNPAVLSLAVSGTTVYAGGWFTFAGGQARKGFAALDAVTGAATAWNPNTSGGYSTSIHAIIISGTTVYVGGDFTAIGGQSRKYIAALDAVTGLATTWNPGANSSVIALALSGTTMYVGGEFSAVGGQSRRYIAALSTATGLASAWNSNANGTVYSLAVSGTTVYAGGDFTGIGGQLRNSIAALDAATGLVTAWNPSANYTVTTLAVTGTTVYAGGEFSAIGGVERDCIAALDATANTNNVTAWDPGAGYFVQALAVSGTTIFAAGSFRSIGGQPRNYIAALDTATGLATEWNPGADNVVHALAVYGATVYAGGDFTSIGGAVRNHVAALDATVNTNNATAWDPNANYPVSVLAVSGPTVCAGGNFTSIGGAERNHIAALDVTVNTNNATAWNPNADNFVRAMAVFGETIFVGGDFVSVGGQSRNHLAALDATVDTDNATIWNPDSDDAVRTLAVCGTKVCAGGDFKKIGGNPQGYYAEFSLPPAAPANPGATAIGTNTVSWTWQDNSSDETGFNVYDDPGAGVPSTLQTTTAANATSWTHTKLMPNTRYSFQVAATNTYGDSAKTANFTAWTLAATPAAPVVGNPTAGTFDVAIGAGDGNPEYTEYAIYCETTSQWVQPGGAPGASAAWQTATGWGITTVAGLAPASSYVFAVAARNGAGTTTAPGSGVGSITLALVPNVAGLTQVAADAVLGGASLTTGTVTQQCSNSVPAGAVISQNPSAGQEVIPGSAVALVLSTGPCPVAVPNAVGQTLAAAGTLLSDAGLSSGTATQQCSNTVTAGLVISQAPTAGQQVVPGSAVALVLSTGPCPVAVPNVVGQTLAVAGTLLSDAGLTSGTVTHEYSSTVAEGLVISQTPAAGQSVPPDSPVALVASDGPRPITGCIWINNNRSATNNRMVTLALTWSGGQGTGVVRMRFSDDGATWSAWEPLASVRSYLLPSGDGHKTVRVQYLDDDNFKSPVFSDYIRLDTMPPTGTIIINDGALTATTQSVTLKLTWADGDGAQVSRVRFSDDGAHWTAWEIPRISRAYTLPAGLGYHTVRVQCLDGANNYSAIYNDYIKLVAP